MHELGSKIHPSHPGRAHKTTAAFGERQRVDSEVDELRLTMELRALLEEMEIASRSQLSERARAGELSSIHCIHC